MFFFTPTLAPANGWSPKLSPDGRYLVHGITTLVGVDLFPSGGGGVPVEYALPAGSGNSFSAGFLTNGACYYGDFTASQMRQLAVPGWADTLVAASALGTYIQASGGHWATYNAPNYTFDGAAFVPSVGGGSAAGAGQAGPWMAYVITGNQVVIEKFDGSTARIIDGPTPGSIAAWRVFAGPDGGYLFYVADGQLWINNPAGVSIVANLPGTNVENVNGGFGALSWLNGDVTQLWVTTYAYKASEARYYALHRPVGDSQVIALPDIGANNFSMQVGQWPTGWTICGATDGTLGCWVEIPYASARTSFAGSTGQGATFPSSGGGGGGTPTNPSGSPGTAVLDSQHAAPPLPGPGRPRPHVEEIGDYPTRQSLTLLWDRVGELKDLIDAVQKNLREAGGGQ